MLDVNTLAKRISSVATTAVPVLGNLLSAEQVIAGIVSQLHGYTLDALPRKPDGSAYTAADVEAAALRAHAAWHAADLPAADVDHPDLGLHG